MLKRIADDDSGLTYTLEAILGIFLIIGAVIYATGNMPPMPHKTGELSKVQLMNIGRDTIDLTLITPVFEIGGGEPIENYTLLVFDKTIGNWTRQTTVNIGETVNFTVRNVKTNVPINANFYFNGTTLVISRPYNITSNVTKQSDGNQSWTVPSGISPYGNYTYAIQASDSTGGVSNFVSVQVGYYNLTSYTSSISVSGTVSGVVTDASGSGSAGLTIKIFDNNMKAQPSPFNMTVTNGTFSFDWLSYCTKACNTGTYYLQASNATGRVSNYQIIEFTKTTKETLCASYSGYSSCDNITGVLEGDTVTLYMNDYGTIPGNYFWVDYTQDAKIADGNYLGAITTVYNSTHNAIFRANVPGVYSIATDTNALGNGQGYISTCSGCQMSNVVLIYVIPITAEPIGDTCVNATELNTYTRRYLPSYVNYNLYLIGPNGSRFTRCPDFPTGQVINGYPTAEAMTVSKLTHIRYPPPPYTPIVDNITEYRMELWYK